MSQPVFTIKCPICGKGRIPYPFSENKFAKCEMCGAFVNDEIKNIFNFEVKIGLFFLKIILILIPILLICDWMGLTQ